MMKRNFLKVFILIIMMGLPLVLVACDSGENDATKTITDFYAGIEIPKVVEVGDNLGLPLTMEGGSISYLFNPSGYINSDLEVVNAENNDITVTMTVTIIVGSTQKKFEERIKITKLIESTFRTLEEYVRGTIPASTRSNLNLKYSYYGMEGISFTYFSSHPEIVSHSGLYIEHRYDTEVTLTVTIYARGQSNDIYIKFNSVGLLDIDKVNETVNWLNDYMEKLTVSEGMELPTEHPNLNGRITWMAHNPYCISDGKHLYFPEETGQEKLFAEICFGNLTQTLSFSADLPKSSMTELERVQAFLRDSYAIATNEFIVLFDGTGPLIDKSKYIDPSTAKERLTSGLHPQVPQETLDTRLWPGYKINNPENILWVVVHETGNTTATKDALVHANLQYNNAYTSYDRAASWNYQVDDGVIYQSYGDELITWHASDGTSTAGGGNSNGIGIEMCVNCDGRYEAAMRQDARLIASLLIKYNMGIANVKQHYDFAPDKKNCPEQMRDARRWYEFLNMIAREYVSQSLLSKYEVTYSFNSGEIIAWKVGTFYQVASTVTDEAMINIGVLVDGSSQNYSIKYKK